MFSKSRSWSRSWLRWILCPCSDWQRCGKTVIFRHQMSWSYQRSDQRSPYDARWTGIHCWVARSKLIVVAAQRRSSDVNNTDLLWSCCPNEFGNCPQYHHGPMQFLLLYYAEHNPYIEQPYALNEIEEVMKLLQPIFSLDQIKHCTALMDSRTTRRWSRGTRVGRKPLSPILEWELVGEMKCQFSRQNYFVWFSWYDLFFVCIDWWVCYVIGYALFIQ